MNLHVNNNDRILMYRNANVICMQERIIYMNGFLLKNHSIQIIAQKTTDL